MGSVGLAETQHYFFRPELHDKNKRIYHRIEGGMRESHPSVQDLQSTTGLAESWMLQILHTRMRFPHPFLNVIIIFLILVKQEAQRATYRAPEYNVPPF